MNRQLKPYPRITHTPSAADDNHLCWHIIDTMCARGYSNALAFGVDSLVRAYLADARGIQSGDDVMDDVTDAGTDSCQVVVPTCAVEHAY